MKTAIRSIGSMAMDVVGILLGLLPIGFGYFFLLPSLFYPGIVVLILGILTFLGGIVTTPSKTDRAWSEYEEEEQQMTEYEVLFIYDD